MHHRRARPHTETTPRNRDPTTRPCCWRRPARIRACGRAASCRPRSWCRRSRPSQASTHRLRSPQSPAARSRGEAPRRATGRSARRAPAARGAGACTTASAPHLPAPPDRHTPPRAFTTACCSRPDATTQIEPQVERDLLVARAAGVQAPARITDALDQLTLDEAVHVFVWSGDPRRIATTLLEDLVQRGDDGASYRRRTARPRRPAPPPRRCCR